jgi:IMP cyclohydrolase
MNDDFSELENMIYSGRGITVGMTPDIKPFIGYSLAGRSPSSQARKLTYDNISKSVAINVTDDAILNTCNKLLLVYMAMAIIDDVKKKMIASNGRQTALILQTVYAEGSLLPYEVLVKVHRSKVFEDGINLTSYEPDAPNFTPRISGCTDGKTGALYIVRKKPHNNEIEDDLFTFMLEPGQAKALTTYHGGNENPLLPFKYKNPIMAKIVSNTASDICESIYAAIGLKGDNNYRIAAAVMLLRGKKDLDVAIINRFDRGN